MNGSGGLLEPSLSRFVDRHVRSLIGWEILLFFHKHPEAVMDVPALAGRLGRRQDDIADDVDSLCRSDILSCKGGLVRFSAAGDTGRDVDRFAAACSDRAARMALVAQVLEKIDAGFR
jgi:hypothetical protein